VLHCTDREERRGEERRGEERRGEERRGEERRGDRTGEERRREEIRRRPCWRKGGTKHINGQREREKQWQRQAACVECW
jgi:hypothetical protein